MKECFEESIGLVEMSNLVPSQTGLPMTIWVSSATSSGKELKHGPRIKVSSAHGERVSLAKYKAGASITISDSPKIVDGEMTKSDFEVVKKFIIRNKEILLKYWRMAISTKDMMSQIRRVKK